EVAGRIPEAHLWRQGDREVLEGHSKLNFEEPQYQADGTTKMVLASKIPMKDKSGNIIGILGIYTDISDRKLAEQREKKAIEETIEAKKQNEIMQNQVHLFKQLSGTVAHELFTPLRGVKAGFNFITKQVAKLTEAYQEGLSAGILKEKISEKAMRNLDKSLSNITKEIDYSFLFIEMLLANIRSEKFTGEPLKNCFIADAVDEALMRYPLNDTQKQKISTNLAYNFIYAGSQQLLIHVLFNLLKNALYYVAKARKGEITLWTVEKEKVNELHFKDTGEGISAEVLPHIFEQFFSKTLHGTGVGLTYCNMVMQSFGGSIDCQSIEGEYTEFILKFPKVTA
ncbi:MAG: PAS domain-containing protein, partial [Proteobacteria bacterium]|nr:PAS domain-containing protein [Pseudomonadota bacterium]